MDQERVVILGGGESGCYAARLGQLNGYTVFLSDSGKLSEERKAFLNLHGIAYEEGGHSEEIVLFAELIIKSPGIPQDHPLIQKIRAKPIPVLSEIEWAYRFQKSKIVAITGSNGKTTTTRLIHHILNSAGLQSTMAGNIGDSFSRYACGIQSEIVVLELSSFQLEDIQSFKPDVAVLLNITPDHLDRYEYSMQLYANAKLNMIRNMDENDIYVYNGRDEIIASHPETEKCLAVKIPVGVREWTPDQFVTEAGEPFDVRNSVLKGRHNALNIAAATAAVKAFGVSTNQVQEALRNFQNEAHRLEFIDIVDGVEYINDSKATNTDAVFYALEAMQKPVIWIVGGQDKGNDYSLLDKLVESKVVHIIALGVDNKKILDHYGSMEMAITDTHSMDEALDIAFQVANPGQVVLLSPACASFDLFNNYKHRGDLFKSGVWEKKNSKNI